MHPIHYDFSIYGNRDKVTYIKNLINSLNLNNSPGTVSWFFTTKDGSVQKSSVALSPTTVLDEHYPYLKGGVNSFIQEYLSSNSTIMILYGPPGTGKTSFIRHMLFSNKLKGIVTYDEKVLDNEMVFCNFMVSNEHDIMIIEDADTMMNSRERDHNRIMNRFLNVSDGIIKFPNKKIIFTSNSTNLDKVDDALVRPGRCFAAIEFRKLSPDEAATVASISKLPNRDWAEKQEWSLTEVYNNDTSISVEKNKIRKFIGF